MQEVFSKIIRRIEVAVKSSDNSNFTNGLLSAQDIIKQEAEQYNNGWIPCSERLPKDRADVLVWFEYFRYGNYNRLFRTIGISYTYNGQWSGFVNGSSGWRDLTIFAWQPLPAPYQPKEKV